MLSAWEIRAAVASGDIVLDNLDPGLVQPASVDLRLGHEFLVARATPRDFVLDPYEYDSADLFQRFSGSIVLEPGDFVLATTYETVTLSEKICATVEGKSSLARLGILVHQTAGFVDPGFSGELTLELTLVAPWPTALHPRMPICQLSFSRMNGPDGSGERYQGKYGGQWGPQTSRYFQNVRERAN